MVTASQPPHQLTIPRPRSSLTAVCLSPVCVACDADRLAGQGQGESTLHEGGGQVHPRSPARSAPVPSRPMDCSAATGRWPWAWRLQGYRLLRWRRHARSAQAQAADVRQPHRLLRSVPGPGRHRERQDAAAQLQHVRPQPREREDHLPHHHRAADPGQHLLQHTIAQPHTHGRDMGGTWRVHGVQGCMGSTWRVQATCTR